MAKQLVDLQQLTAEGDEKAFEQLYLLHKDRVYEIALTYTESVVLAEEILQDIFVQVWVKRNELPGITDFSAWLFILTRNRSFTVLRGLARAAKRDRGMVDYLPHAGETADEKLLSGHVQRFLHEAMNLLTPAQRTAFELFKLNGLSRDETAAAMGISPNTAKTHLQHAMRIIRAHLVSNDIFLPVALPLFLPFL
jgi:RNA polymerase sigma-70 factor (ECF subfamily)